MSERRSTKGGGQEPPDPPPFDIWEWCGTYRLNQQRQAELARQEAAGAFREVVNDVLARVAQVADESRQATADADSKRAERDRAIQAAVVIGTGFPRGGGLSRQAVADAAGLSRANVSRIVDRVWKADSQGGEQ